MTDGSSEAPVLIVHSFHHQNTLKVGQALAEILGAKIKTPQEADPAEIAGRSLAGFGSGIYHARHSAALLALVERLPRAAGAPAFLFSTSGVYNPRKLAGDHAALRDLLVQKGFTIAGEFGCRGWDTYSFLKYFGGLNRGRPNAEDLERASAFARRLREQLPPSNE